MLLSPAKSLDFAGRMPATLAECTATQPLFDDDVVSLVGELAKLSKTQIKKLMGLSDALATLNHERYQTFTSLPLRPAIGAFQGQAYKGLEAEVSRQLM